WGWKLGVLGSWKLGVLGSCELGVPWELGVVQLGVDLIHLPGHRQAGAVNSVRPATPVSPSVFSRRIERQSAVSSSASINAAACDTTKICDRRDRSAMRRASAGRRSG